MSQQMIPIAKPCFTGNEIDLIAEVMKTGWIVQGPMVAKFEEDVAKYTGAKHAVATTSCTTSLHLAMLINGIGPGDDVICPSYSFIATANSIKYSGAQPQFVDIDPQTLNLDPVATKLFIDANYTPDMRNKQTGNKLRGILLVHQIGIPADVDAFAELCRLRGLKLMEDSACGLGSMYKGKPIGASGNVSALSFHPRKVISCGEGGMVLTDDTEQAEKARVLRAHGMSLSDLARHKAGSTTYETYDVLGYNYRMTDLQAAIGIKQLEALETFIEKRIRIAEYYNKAFTSLEEIEIIYAPAYATRWNCQSYPIRLKRGGRTERDAAMRRLEERGVMTRRGIPPIHNESIYSGGLPLPNTQSVSDHSLFIPIFPQLSGAEVEHVARAVKECVTSKVGAAH